MTHIHRMRMHDGTIRETEVTTGQLLDLAAGLGLPMHTVRDERFLVDDDGTITVRENATPPNPDPPFFL